MYWNNPIHTVIYPSNSDIIFKSMHGGAHCLFYNPCVPKQDIYYQQTLQDLCDWVNQNVSAHGWQEFFADSRNHYDTANLVKLNLLVHDLPLRGSIKPMLLNYNGGKYNSDFNSGTGAKRLRAMERLPQIQTVSAFITTASRFQQDFSQLELITSFNRFAELCQAEPGQEFLFRLTDSNAPYGMDWYEYNSRLTVSVTPNTDICLMAFKSYVNKNKNIVFTPEWFESYIEWEYLQL